MLQLWLQGGGGSLISPPFGRESERTGAPRLFFVILNQYFAAARGASTKVSCEVNESLPFGFLEERGVTTA
jgi:hypothetical protein